MARDPKQSRRVRGTAASRTLTLEEAAERLGVHYMTAYRYVRLGRLPATLDDGRWSVRVADLDTFAAAPAPNTRSARKGAPQWGPYRKRLQARLLAGDDTGAWAVTEQALIAGATPTDIYVELVGPVLRHIGRLWERGTWSIAEEHRATAAARRVVGRVTPRFARRGRNRGSVLLGGVAGDPHELPLAMLADVLRGAAFDVVDLGANTPVESMLEAVGADHFLAVGISASTEAGVKAAHTTVRALHRDHPGLPVLAGGAAVTAEIAEKLGADGWAPDARAAVTLVEGLLR